MHILVTCDSYKDCLTAEEVGKAIISGIAEDAPGFHVTHIPVADGGEGSLKAIRAHMQNKSIECNSVDPLLRPIKAGYLLDDRNERAYIEMAVTSGLELLKPEERNCMRTTSYGTGLLIKDALDRGVNEIILFIGGSATSDMGIGMAAALGVKFYDKDDNLIQFPVGRDLNKINKIEGLGMLKDHKCLLVCDVDNPLYGTAGASYVFAPQKGATTDDVIDLDNGMQNLNNSLSRFYNVDYAYAEGAGAAGGIGAMAMYTFHTRMMDGPGFMIEQLKIDAAIRKADIVITGEGKMDEQTLHGKLISGISKLTSKYKKKLVVVCGIITLGEEGKRSMGIAESYSLAHISGDQSYTPESTIQLLRDVGKRIAGNYTNI